MVSSFLSPNPSFSTSRSDEKMGIFCHHIIFLCISALVSCFNRNDSQENEVTKTPCGLKIKSVFLIKLKGSKEKAKVNKAMILQSIDFLAKFYNMQSAV